MSKHKMPPPLPKGWTWHRDLDNYWCVRRGDLSVHVATDPPGECVAVTVRPAEAGPVHGVPVRLAVAVMQANGLPWEPSVEPLRDDYFEEWVTSQEDGAA